MTTLAQDATLVVSSKSRRETRLPLPQDVGDALLPSLESARPPVDSDRVCIPAIAPWGPRSRAVIRQTAARAITRAGIRAPTSGARVLRHSAATFRRFGAKRLIYMAEQGVGIACLPDFAIGR